MNDRRTRGCSGRLRRGDVCVLFDNSADLSLTQHLEEGLGQGQVNQSVVLQGLGQEHAQKPEQLGHSGAQGGVLSHGSREQAALATDVETHRPFDFILL